MNRSVAALAGPAVAVTGLAVAAVAGRVAPPVPMAAAVGRVAARAWLVGARYPVSDDPCFPMAGLALRTQELPSPEAATKWRCE